jgi:protein-S-isoprenylcysteine O-methyltransferase Ste14
MLVRELPSTHAPEAAARPAEAGPGNPVPPMAVCAMPFLLGLWWETRHAWPIETSGSVALLFTIGWALIVAGYGLFVAGLVTFARADTGILLTQAATSVVMAGPYRWTRNPMYLGFVVLYAGGSLAANTCWPLVALPFVVLVLDRVVIAREERYMRRTFSARYLKYMLDVPRWL